MSGSAGGGSDAEILKLGIDSSGVQKGADAAEAALEALVTAADKTEQALDEVSTAAKETGAALNTAGRGVESFTTDVKDVGNAAQGAAVGLEKLTAVNATVAAKMQAMNAAARASGASLDVMRAEALAADAAIEALHVEIDGLKKSLAQVVDQLAQTHRGLGGTKQKTDEAADAFRRHASGAKLSAKELQMLAPQLNDIFVQLSMGQGMMMTLMAQGPQIVQGFGGVAATFQRIVQVVGPVKLGFLGIAAAGAAMIAVAEKQEKAILNLGTRLMDVRKDYDAYARAAEQVVRKTAATSPITVSEGMDAARILGSVKGVEATEDSLGRLLLMTKNLAAVMGKDMAEAAEKMADDLKKPDEAARRMAESGKRLDTELAREIESLMRRGKLTEAQTMLLERQAAVTAGAAERNTALGQSWEKLKESAQNLWNAISPLVVLIGSALADTLAGVVDIITAFTNAIAGAAKQVGDWYDKAKAAIGLTGNTNLPTGPARAAQIDEGAVEKARATLEKVQQQIRNGANPSQPLALMDQAYLGLGNTLGEIEASLKRQIAEYDALIEREKARAQAATQTAEAVGRIGQNAPVLTVMTPQEALKRALANADRIGNTANQAQIIRDQRTEITDALRLTTDPAQIARLQGALRTLGQQMEGLTPAMTRYVRDMEDSIRVTRAGEGAARALAEAEVAINNAIRAESGGMASAAQLAEARRLAQEKLNAELDVYIEQQGRRIRGLEEEAAGLDQGTEAGERARISVQAQAEALRYGAQGTAEYEAALKRLLDILPRVAAAETLKRDAAARDEMRIAADVTRQETDTLGMGARDRARRLAEIQEEAKIRREKGDLSSASARDRIREAVSLADTKLDSEQINAAFKEIESVGTRAFDRIGEAITQAFATGQISAINMGNIAKAIMSELIQTALKLAVINPLKNWAFGSNEGTLWSAGGAITRMLGGGGGGGGTGLMDLLGLSSLIPKDGLLSSLGITGSGGLMASINSSLFGTAGAVIEPSLATGAAGLIQPGTAGLLGSGGVSTLGGLLGGVGLGFGAGSFVGGLIAGNSPSRQTNSMIGAGLGSLAGAGIGLAMNLAFPGLGMLAALAGGLLGGGAGGLIGPPAPSNGWSFALRGNGAGLGAETGTQVLMTDQYYNEQGDQYFRQAEGMVNALNAYLRQNGLTVTGARAVGGNRDGMGNLGYGEAASVGEALASLRFGSASDPRLNTALAGQGFDDPAKLQAFVQGFNETVAALDGLNNSQTRVLAEQLKAVAARFDALSEAAKKYSLAETGLADAREKALNAVYQQATDARRQLRQGLGNDAVQASGMYGALQASRNMDQTAARDAFTAQLQATAVSDADPIAQFYRAVLGRAPDDAGLSYWQRRQAEGMSRGDIVNSMMASSEGQARYAGMDNTQVIGSFYRSAFNREADAEGLAYWVGEAAKRSIGEVLRDILAGARGDDIQAAAAGTETSRATYQFDAVSRLTQSNTDLAVARERKTGGAALFGDFMGGAADVATEWAAAQARIVEPLKALGLSGDELAAAIATTTESFNKAATQARQSTETSITADWLRATGNDVAAQQMEFDFQRTTGRDALVPALEKLAQTMGDAGADWMAGLLAKYDETTVLNRAKIGAGGGAGGTDYAVRIAEIRGESQLRAGVATSGDQQAVALMRFDASAATEIRNLTTELNGMGQTAALVAEIITEREAAIAAERLKIIDEFAREAAEKERAGAEVRLNLETRRLALSGGDATATRMALFDIDTAREMDSLARTLSELGTSASETADLVAKLTEVRGMERAALLDQIAAEEARRAQALRELVGSLDVRGMAASGNTTGAATLERSLANTSEVLAVTDQLKTLGASADVTTATLEKLAQVQQAEADAARRAQEEQERAEAERRRAAEQAARAEAERIAQQIADMNATIQQRVLRVMGRMSEAALAEFDARAKAELRQMQELGGNTGELTRVQGMERAALVFDLARQDYVEAIDRQIRALEDQYDASERLHEALRDMAKALDQFVADLRLNEAVSTLTPEQRLAEARGRFDTAIATAGDPTATEQDRAKAVADAQRLAQDVLGASEEVYGRATASYAEQFDAVTGALTGLSGKFNGEAGPAPASSTRDQIEELRKLREQALRLGEQQVGGLEQLRNITAAAFAALMTARGGGATSATNPFANLTMSGPNFAAALTALVQTAIPSIAANDNTSALATIFAQLFAGGGGGATAPATGGGTGGAAVLPPSAGSWLASVEGRRNRRVGVYGAQLRSVDERWWDSRRDRDVEGLRNVAMDAVPLWGGWDAAGGGTSRDWTRRTSEFAGMLESRGLRELTADGVGIIGELQALRLEVQALRAVTAQGAVSVTAATKDTAQAVKASNADAKLAMGA